MKFLSQINVNTEYTLPMVDGTNGQVLSTDGSGVAYWGTISAGSLTLDGLSDVVIASPLSGQILRYGIPVGSSESNPFWHNWTHNFVTTTNAVTITGAQTITGSKTFTAATSMSIASGSSTALTITKAGNGEALYVDKTSGSGNAVTVIGTLNATNLVRNGGTSSQFLKADGSVDTSTYLTSIPAHTHTIANVTGLQTALDGKAASSHTHAASDITSGVLSTDRLPKQELGISIVGNFGQWQAHGAYTNFNTDVSYWGWNFVQGGTNAPHQISSQWYRGRFSLGDEYGLGTSPGDYWMEIAIPRYNQSSTSGNLFVRTAENGVINGWQGVRAAYATDAAYAAGAEYAEESGYSASSGSVEWTNIQSKPATFPPSAHNHDDRYYTETESDSRFYLATNPSGYITGISFANVSSKPTTIAGYGITDAITTTNIGNQSVSFATVSSRVIDSPSTRITAPEGASSVNNGSGTGGAIRIQLPTAAYNNNTMMSMTVHVYLYATGQSFTLRIGGYNYLDGNWYNVFASILSDSGKSLNVPVYFGNNGVDRNVIWIGDSNSSWEYPNVFVTDFQVGHSQNSAWAKGWVVSFSEAEQTNVSTSRIAYRQIDAGNIDSYALTSLPAHTHTIANVTGLQTALDSKLSAEADTLGSVTSRGNVATTGIRNEGGHYTTLYENVLPAANNGSGGGIAQMAWWVSEPGITWSNGGFGYNVINDGGAPYGFSRRNTSFGQAYMRMSTSGDWYFYNANTSGVRVTTMTLTPAGDVGIGTTPTTKLDVNGVITATGGNSTQWNTAYGWGDHAAANYASEDFVTSQGYITGYTETDTLASVTGRGGSTGSPVVMYGKVTLGNNSSGTYSGNTTGLTLNSTAEVRSTGIQNPPALTWHYEGLATRHLLMTSAGAFNFVSPSNEASGVAVVQVNGNTVWHAGNLTNLNQLTNGPGYITGYTEADTLASVTGRGNTTTDRINVRGIGNQSGGNIMIGNVGEGSVKWSFLTGTHFNATSQPQGFSLIGGLSTSTGNAVVIGGAIYESNPATQIQFWTHSATTHNLGGSQKMVIDENGNVGINTTTPDSKLEVNGRVSIRGANELYFGQSTGQIGTWTTRMYASGSTHKFNAQTFIFNNEGYGSSEFMSINSTGLTVSGTITEQSSIRYKKDVVGIESTSERVELLKPVRYKKIENEVEEIGLIAEDVAELFPEVVRYDDEGRPDGVNYSRLSVILLKAVQELTERVNKLENK